MNLAKGAKAVASNTRGSDYLSSNILDEYNDTYWATDDEVIESELVINFSKETTFNRLVLQEYIPLGQRIKAFKVEVKEEDGYKEIANETTIGYKRILRLPQVNTSQLKITFTDAKGSPTISNLEVYLATSEPPAE